MTRMSQGISAVSFETTHNMPRIVFFASDIRKIQAFEHNALP
jgi:hypothetical protein